MVLIALLISTAMAAVPSGTESMIVRLETARVEAAEFSTFVADEDAEVRARAAVALARTRSASALAPLRALVNDPDRDVRMAAAFGLGQIKESRSIVGQRLKIEGDTDVRAALIHALGLQGNAWDIDLLVDIAQQPIDRDHSAEEIATAANALGQMAVRGIDTVRIDWVVRALALQTRRANRLVRYHNAFALARIGPTSGGAEIGDELITAANRESDGDTRALLLRAASRYPGADEALRRAAKHGAVEVRIGAARAAVTANWTGVTALLSDPEPAVKLAAIEAVGRMPILDRPALLGPIVQAGADLTAPKADGETTDPRLAAAVEALRALDIPEIWWENDTARYNRVQAGLKPSLTQYMAEEQDPLIRAAGTAIAADPENLLRLALNDSSAGVRMAAANRILGDGVGTYRALSLLNSSDELVLSAVAEWLTERPRPKTEAALLNLARDGETPQLVTSSVNALAALCETKRPRRRGSPAAAALLPKVLGHRDASVRTAGVRLAKCIRAWSDVTPETATRPNIDSVREVRSGVISTAYGDIVVELYPYDAPVTVHNFARLADAGFYDGLPFHRVIPDFVAQGGDPRGDGFGGPGHTIPDEINAMSYDVGTLGMALSGPDTGGSQWFITMSRQPHLDHRYTVFGKVVHGMHVARALLPGDRIENISIERVMTSEVLAADELERAQAMLDALNAPEDDTRPPKLKKKPKKKKAKKKAEKKAKARDDRNAERSKSTDVDSEASEAEDPNEDLPDEVEDREEAPTLNEGEKVDVIDPNAEE